MSRYKIIPARKINNAYLLVVYALFAAVAMVVALVGSSYHKKLVNTTQLHSEILNASTYLSEKIHQHNTPGQITIQDINGISAIVLHEEIDNGQYSTYIYYHEGWMKELTLSNTTDFSPNAGQTLVPLSRLEYSLVSPSLFKIVISCPEQQDYIMYLDILPAQ